MTTNLHPNDHPPSNRKPVEPSKVDSDHVSIPVGEQDEFDEICEKAINEESSEESDVSTEDNDYEFDEYKNVPVGEESRFQLTYDVVDEKPSGLVAWIKDKFQ